MSATGATGGADGVDAGAGDAAAVGTGASADSFGGLASGVTDRAAAVGAGGAWDRAGSDGDAAAVSAGWAGGLSDTLGSGGADSWLSLKKGCSKPATTSSPTDAAISDRAIQLALFLTE